MVVRIVSCLVGSMGRACAFWGDDVVDGWRGVDSAVCPGAVYLLCTQFMVFGGRRARCLGVCFFSLSVMMSYVYVGFGDVFFYVICKRYVRCLQAFLPLHFFDDRRAQARRIVVLGSQRTPRDI